MAGELGEKVGRPFSIVEESPHVYYPAQASNRVREAAGDGFADESTIAPGQIVITARVTVSFELE